MALAASCEEADEQWAAAERCMLVSRLSTVLKGIPNNEISSRSIAFVEAATVTLSRPDCVTGNTSGTVLMGELCNALWGELLSPVLLNHMQHEAVVRGSSEGCKIWTTLSEGIPVAAVSPVAGEVSESLASVMVLGVKNLTASAESPASLICLWRAVRSSAVRSLSWAGPRFRASPKRTHTSVSAVSELVQWSKQRERSQA